MPLQPSSILKLGLRFLLLLCIPEALATDYFISNKGNDKNSGLSADLSWKSVEKVNKQKLKPGDQVFFKGGDEFQGNLILDESDETAVGNPIVVSSYAEGRATLLAGVETGILVRNLGYVEIRNLVVKGASRLSSKGSGIEFRNELPNSKKLKGITVENVRVSSFGKHGIYIYGAAKDGSLNGYDGIKIINCLANDNLHTGILVYGNYDKEGKSYANSNLLVLNCKVYDNSGDPNFKENHSGSGMLIDATDGGKIERCEAYNNGVDCHANVGGPIGIWGHASNNLVFQYNISHDNRTGSGSTDGGGFDFDGGVSNSVFQYNYSYNNDGAGFLLYVYSGSPYSFKNNTVRYNISENDCRKNSFGAIHAANDGNGVVNLEIYNNTIITRPSTTGKPKAVTIHRTKAVRFYNNILWSEGDIPLLEIGEKQEGLTFIGNNYWSRDGKLRILWEGKTFEQLNSWAKESGFELKEGKETFYSVDPTFKPTGQGAQGMFVYSLDQKSPLIDSGVDLEKLELLKKPERDIFGNKVPANGNFDIGAAEYSKN